MRGRGEERKGGRRRVRGTSPGGLRVIGDAGNAQVALSGI